MARSGSTTVRTGLTSRGSPFQQHFVHELRNFAKGLNTKVASHLIEDEELQDVLNMNYDQNGSLQKRKGFKKHYTVQFGTGPIRGLYNYRRENGTSVIVACCDGKVFSDNPQFTKLWDTEADWEETGSTRTAVDTTSTPGDVRLLIVLGIGGPGYQVGKILVGKDNAFLASYTGNWVSAALDITTVSDKTSGVITDVSTLPAGTTRLIETRTAAASNMSGASAWAALGPGGTVVSPANNFIQVRITFTSNNMTLIPSTQSIQLTFDTTAAPVAIGSGLDSSARFAFETMNDVLWIVNGVDANRKWDGTTFATQGGTPPTVKFIRVHKNRMFLAGQGVTNRSRLYFSDLQLPESWPALNFIDVGKGDGDAITALVELNDNLIIFKDNSVWALQGDSPTTFILRRITNDAGCIDHHTVTAMKNSLALVSRDGIRFFDGVRNAIGSDKIQPTFLALNQKFLKGSSAIYFQNKIYFAVPNGVSQTNNLMFIFDITHGSWTKYDIPASELVIWRQYNKDYLLMGSTSIGQVYDMETGYNDDGAAIDCYAVTKAFDLGGLSKIKLIRSNMNTVAEPSQAATPMLVSYFVDQGAESSSVTANLVLNKALNALRSIPSTVGASIVRTLAVKVRHNTVNLGFNVYAIAVEYIDKGIRQSS